MLALCEPVKNPVKLLPSETCSFNTKKNVKTHHPYDLILAKDMTDEIESHSIVCLYHQNRMQNRERRLVRNEFENSEMLLRQYNKDVAEICLKNTRFEPLLKFSVGYHFTISFANDINKISKIINITKKYPQMFLLCAMIDKRRVVTVEQLNWINNCVDLNTQRAMLYSTLSAGTQALLNTLNRHQSDLTRTLQTLSDQTENK